MMPIPGTRALGPAPAGRTTISCSLCRTPMGEIPTGTALAVRGVKATRQHELTCPGCGNRQAIPLVEEK